MKTRTLVCALLACLLYLIGGAFLFMAIESDSEIQRQKNILLRLNGFLENNTCTSPQELLDFLDFVDKDLSLARYVMRQNVTGNVMWDFSGTMSFLTSVITTIGYGHIVPRTTLGQFTCVVYGLVGIPLLMVCLSGLGEKLRQLSERCLAWKLPRVGRPTTQRRINLSLQCILGFFFVFVLPTTVYMNTENWTMAESLYYIFITLMTIGFGDFVANNPMERDNFSTTLSARALRSVNFVWTLIGLAFISMGINTIMQFYLEGTRRTEELSDRGLTNCLKRLKQSLRPGRKANSTSPVSENGIFH